MQVRHHGWVLAPNKPFGPAPPGVQGPFITLETLHFVLRARWRIDMDIDLEIDIDTDIDTVD